MTSIIQSAALARPLVMSFGWNSTACQILNPGIRHWFSAARDAVVGYTRRHDSLLVAGAPVCALEKLPAVCEEFESYAREQGCRVCYVCAEERLRGVFSPSTDHAAVALGAQPVWNPQTWAEMVKGRSSLRAQLNRARNKGVVIDLMRPEDAASSLDVRQILNEWLKARTLPPLHFLVEPDVLDGIMTDRVVLIARMPDRAVAFLVASPVVGKNGYLLELLARRPGAPNGVSELLIDTAMRRFAGEGREHVTLGLVALANAARQEISANPTWLRALMGFARAHANRFYNFRGLEQFRVKLAPAGWEPIYAISNEPSFSVRTLYNMGAAFSGIQPWQALAIGLAKALGQELRGNRG
jgi:phosphatidylglycerol lysyltransferase